MKTKFILGVFAFAVLTFGSCTKAKDGAPGVAGKDGNANVTVFNKTVAPSSWVSDGSGGWSVDFTATGFNPTVGAIEVFYSTDNSNWFALPLTVSSNMEILYMFNSSTVSIDIAALTSTPLGAMAVTTYFKIVSIPPAMHVANPNIDFKSYTQIRDAFNLKD